MADNTLYYGDNLDILRRYIKDETVDLVYLDPPFNSNASYNILFAEKNGTSSSSQIQAFDDTWHWNMDSERAYDEMMQRGGKVADAMEAFRTLLGENDMLAYLAMMAPRLVELRRVLKSTGSIYLHCDPTASHYLKVLMDAVFGGKHFKNEIVWKRTSAHSDSNRYGANIDIVLYFTKTAEWTWNQHYTAHSEEYMKRFRNTDEDGRLWADDNITAKGLSGGGYEYEYKGVKSLWRVPPETMKRLDSENRLHFTNRGGIRIKRYLDETKGLPLQTLWTDISPINSQAQERLGYPTQKPEALLERIISASSNEGDVVLDPFCGCGTAIVAAQKLKRRWIGIDITPLATNLIKYRLADSFGDEVKYRLIGEPTTVEDARKLAEQDPYHFQYWALGLIGARPEEEKKGADRGIDGRRRFYDPNVRGNYSQIIISVKAGKVSVPFVRDLRGTVEREGAAIGVLITMQEPTGPMLKDAASAGFYESPWGKHPRIQILTIEKLLADPPARIDCPQTEGVDATFRRARRQQEKPQNNQTNFLGEEE